MSLKKTYIVNYIRLPSISSETQFHEINLIFWRINVFSECFREANLFLGIFNLLPFFSLDGGNIMKIVAKLIRLW